MPTTSADIGRTVTLCGWVARRRDERRHVGEAPRRREYPLPPLRWTDWHEKMAIAEKYLIDSVLGVGGMGVIYLARHSSTPVPSAEVAAGRRSSPLGVKTTSGRAVANVRVRRHQPARKWS